MRQDIIDSYREIGSFTKVALIFGLSKQRIHQIVTNYNFTGRGHKRSRKIAKLYDNLGNCIDCGKKAKVLHHIDFINEHDDLFNLAPLCNKCHTKRHLEHNEKVFGDEKCIVCGDILVRDKRVNDKICVACYQYKKNHERHPVERNVIRQKFYPKNCIVCGIVTIGKKRWHGKCSKCFAVERNATQRQKDYRKEYYHRKWEENKELFRERCKQRYIRIQLGLM